MPKRDFRELVTPYLRGKIDDLRCRFGEESREYHALTRQYLRSADEDSRSDESNLRHYEADVSLEDHGKRIPGIERLYRRTLVIEPTLACAAHCRYCIRANYPRHHLSESQLLDIARFCGAGENRNDLTEVLVTGGDVLLVPQRVDYLVNALIEHAPNVRIVRIATRIPVQDPVRVNDEVLKIFKGKPSLRFELATQINHRIELFPEVVEAFNRIMATGARVYAQNVLLRGVNDDLDTLVDLYDALREFGIEAHYLFHCVPLQGMAHLRMTLQSAIDLARSLASCGLVSGRAKPMIAAMTDIGKIVLFDGAIRQRDGRHVLLQSNYRFEDRRRWNPNWALPETAAIDPEGFLRVWYLDGTDEKARLLRPDAWPAARPRHRIISLPLVSQNP